MVSFQMVAFAGQSWRIVLAVPGGYDSVIIPRLDPSSEDLPTLPNRFPWSSPDHGVPHIRYLAQNIILNTPNGATLRYTLVGSVTLGV